MTGRWRISIDAGGTFTDCIATTPEGELRREKVLSDGTLRMGARVRSPRELVVDDASVAALFAGCPLRVRGEASEQIIGEVSNATRTIELETPLDDEGIGALASRGVIEILSAEPAPLLAIRLATRTRVGEALPAISLRLATTRATNALLERKYPRVALFVTRGFGDLLEIGDQRRPDLFTLDIRKPVPITRDVWEIDERIDAEGEIVRPFDERSARDQGERAREAEVGIAAIALLNSHANAAHERALERILKERGFQTVVRSSDIASRIHLLSRAQTCVVEAALFDVLGDYLRAVDAAIGEGTRHVLTSTGGVSDMGSFRAVDGLLSGPAGGVMGARAVARGSGFQRVISFDMGGTSTDVARIDGEPERVTAHEVGAVRIARPALAIETVAAGGGSICAVRDGRPAVGPESAGAHPGPACYGAGGPLTLTDANVLLARLIPERFQIPLDTDAGERALDEFIAQLASGGDGSEPTREQVLTGLLDLGDEHMAEAIRRISVRKGYDPAEFALVAFGGAGPQHACSIADRLGIDEVLIPPDASLLSAVGVASAPIERGAERQILQPISCVGADLAGILDELEADARAELREAEGELDINCRREASLRFVGQQSTIELDAGDTGSLCERFRAESARLFGDDRERAIEVESCRVIAWAQTAAQSTARSTSRGGDAHASDAPRRRRVHDGRHWIDAEVVERASLAAGETVAGPALIVEDTTTTWLAAHWRCAVGDTGVLLLRRDEHRPAPQRSASETMDREIIIHRIDAIAETMGEALRRLAVSTNVKERQDYSCGVLDSQGRLIASAPHIPVHLGALGPCVRGVIDAVGTLGPGDAVVTNHPAFGGSHLPDITVVQGVHDDGGALLGYVASRAHHAEIGGIAPGSMPIGATCLGDEGVVFEPTHLVRSGVACWDEFEARLREASHPSRSPEDNVADLHAGVAAGLGAARELAALVAREGRDAIGGASAWILGHTSALVQEAVGSLETLPASAVERLDQGDEIHVALSRNDQGLLVDFAGTSAQRRDNLNAPLAVTSSAVAYVLRLLLARAVPLNDGLLAPVDIRVPEGSLLNPGFSSDAWACPPVAAGNVEISQRVVEALLRAFNLCAASQGTMNNVLLGSDRFGYYETIAGGTGAGPGFCGTSAVHSHMTNTAITDPEILERRYPLRVERFLIRRGSGGKGRWQGGDGAIRELLALEEMTATVIGQRRVRGAPGALGGHDGAPGAQEIRRAGGISEGLESSASAALYAGDRLLIETPAGGGWGEPV